MSQALVMPRWSDLPKLFWLRLEKEPISMIVLIFLVGFAFWKIEKLDDKVEQCNTDKFQTVITLMEETNRINRESNEISRALITALETIENKPFENQITRIKGKD